MNKPWSRIFLNRGIDDHDVRELVHESYLAVVAACAEGAPPCRDGTTASDTLGAGGEYSFAAVPSSRAPASADAPGPSAGDSLRKRPPGDLCRLPEGRSITMHVTPLVWALTVGFVVAVIVLDLLLADRRPHRISTKEAGLWVGLYVGLAVLFGIGIGVISGWTTAASSSPAT